MIFDVFGHFEAGKKIGTGPANYTDVKKVPPGTFLGPSVVGPLGPWRGVHVSSGSRDQKLSDAAKYINANDNFTQQ